ncbi:transglycosylase family protein [Streptomyces sp. NBC_01456]|uniref:transglycosylase family protein n=1 Tax=unclassified Streptomyces TaxID=2593676 RepID=UPI002E2EAE58|nr:MULTISPECIES: transglycosylase family protein [unclassified Streptomyces]
MRSGNGRHRRPRQAPAIFVTAGVTGAGIALPLLGASGAHAADTTTWDKVAQCESGGEWSAAAGNGYYGGLQLTQEMWDNYGGSAYASRPDLASRAQQIVVAQSILDRRGPEVWTSCAADAGLARDGRAPEVNPGSTGTPAPDPSDDGDATDPWGSSGMHDGSEATGGQDEPGGDTGTGPSDEPTRSTPSPDAPDSGRGGDPSGTPDPSGSATPGDGQKDPSPSADPSDAGSRPDTTGTPREKPAQGRHRGGADHKGGDGSQDGRNGQDSRNSGDSWNSGDGQGDGGGRASRGGDAHRSGPAADGDYTVRPGDSLSAIATAHRLAGGWTALYDRNEGVIGSDADLIQPGQVLDLGQNAG